MVLGQNIWCDTHLKERLLTERLINYNWNNIDMNMERENDLCCHK